MRKEDKNKIYEIYDVMTKQNIIIKYGELGKKCKEIGVDYTSFIHLMNHRTFCSSSRYILPENKHKIFTLVDLDTKQEYDCVTSKTLFLYLNYSINDNDLKYLYELYRKRQGYASVCGRVFYLKENSPPKIHKSNSKNPSSFLKEKKIHTELKARVRRNLLGRINDALKRKDTCKSERTEKLIGCKINFLLQYIEKLFTKNMSWENHGIWGWHIDHIIPCHLFDLRNMDEQLKCFHYTNLRPIWATKEVAMKYGESENYIGNLNRKKDGSN